MAAGLALGVGAGLLVFGGCASPLVGKSDRELRRSVREAAEREMLESGARSDPVRLTRESRVAALGIKPEVMAQLDKIGGPASYEGQEVPLGPSLYADTQSVQRISLQRALVSAVKHNLNVEFARLAPAISQNQVSAAEAAFDWTLFGNTQYNSTDQPRTSSSVGGFQSSVNRDRRDSWDSTIGVRKPLISGGQLSVQTQYTFSDNTSPNLTVRPNPSYDTNLLIQLDQPLLRGFGSDVARSDVRLAVNTELDAIQQLKGTLIQNITETETAYWNLVRAQEDLRIIHRLKERGEETLRVLQARARFDAKPANLTNAQAAVQSRQADVLRAQRVLRDASDRLKVLMNDPELPVGGESLVLPSDAAVDQGVEFSLYDSTQAAITNRPEVQRAIISIDNTSIRQTVADNARLSRLDLRALTRFNGLEGSPGKSYDALGDAEFMDFQVGVQFEQPIGNRAAEARYRSRRIERQQAVVSFRNTVQGIVQELKSSLRDVQTNYQLIEQTRAARIAAAEDLRTLLVEEETIQSLSPEFLNLKLQRQQALAGAEQQEIQALVDYQTALARQAAATGTALTRSNVQFVVPSLVPDAKVEDLFPDWPTEKQRERGNRRSK